MRTLKKKGDVVAYCPQVCRTSQIEPLHELYMLIGMVWPSRHDQYTRNPIL